MNYVNDGLDFELYVDDKGRVVARRLRALQMTSVKQIKCVRRPDGNRVFYDMQGEMLPVIKSTEDQGRDGHIMILVLAADCIDFGSDDKPV